MSTKQMRRQQKLKNAVNVNMKEFFFKMLA